MVHSERYLSQINSFKDHSAGSLSQLVSSQLQAATGVISPSSFKASPMDSLCGRLDVREENSSSHSHARIFYFPRTCQEFALGFVNFVLEVLGDPALAQGL